MTRFGPRGHHRARRAREPVTTVVVETGANEERKVIADLQPYSHYALSVSVLNSKGDGPASEMVSFETDEGGKKARCQIEMVGDQVVCNTHWRWCKEGGGNDSDESNTTEILYNK